MAISEISVSKIYVLATEPTNKVKDRFWFDTTNNLLKRYDGTSWKPISVSSDDVVVLSSGNKISLTNYLNTQIAALAEGIDSKQDKLEHYTETVNSYGTKKSTIDNESFGVYTNAGIELNSDGIITLKGSQIELTGDINGPAISTSIPASINAASDNKILSEKAVADALVLKQDKSALTTSISSASTDTQYPSAKAVYTYSQASITSTSEITITPTASQIATSISGALAKKARVIVVPNINNIGAVYIKESSTYSSVNPIYPDPTNNVYEFSNMQNVRIFVDSIGDSVDLVIEYRG